MNLTITGGEPYLRSDLPEICRIFSEVNETRSITIPTNGLLTDRIVTMTKEMLQSCNSQIKVIVSLDGLEDTHDRIRGIRGIFGKAVQTIKRLRGLETQRNFKGVEVSTVILAENILEISELARFVGQYLRTPQRLQFVRGSSFSVQNLAPGNGSGFDPETGKESLPALDDANALIERLSDMNREPNQSIGSREQMLKLRYAIQTLRERKRLIPCFAGKVFGVVYPSGDISFCELTRPIGNLRDSNFDLHKLWHSTEAKKMRRRLSACYCNDSCYLLTGIRYSALSRLRTREILRMPRST